MNLFKVTSILLIIFIIGCKKKHAEGINDQHLGHVDAEYNSLEKIDLRLTTIKSIHSKIEEMESIIWNKNSFNKHIIETVKELAPYMLKEKYLQCSKCIASNEMVELLELFNKGIERLILTKDGRDLLKANKILDRYEEKLFARNYSKHFYGKDNLVKIIFQHLSETLAIKIDQKKEKRKKLEAQLVKMEEGEARTSKVEEYNNLQKEIYKNIRFYYTSYMHRYSDLNGGVYDGKFYLSYLRYSSDYTDYFNGLEEKKRLSLNKERRVHRDFFGTALIEIRKQKSKETKKTYCQTVSKLKPYTYDISSVDRANLQRMRQFIEEFIDCARGKKGKENLNTIISQYMSSEVNKELMNTKIDIDNKELDLSKSYNLTVNYLKKFAKYVTLDTNYQEKNDLTQLSELDLSKRDDMLLFIIEQFYNEKIDRIMALNYLNAINQDVPEKDKISNLEILKFVKNYIMVQVIYEQNKTQYYLNKILKEEFEEFKGNAPAIFTNVVKDVNTATRRNWNTIKKRSGELDNLMVDMFDSKYSANAMSGNDNEEDIKVSQRYTQLSEIISKLDQSLNYLVTSPIMLVMKYYMAKALGQIDVEFTWVDNIVQTIQFNATKVLKNFFNADHGVDVFRFFDFGNEQYEFSRVEKLHVFDLALRTGIFDNINMTLDNSDRYNLTIDEKNKTLNGEYLFFKQYIKDKLKSHTSTFKRVNNSLSKILSNTSNFDGFAQACNNPLGTSVHFSGVKNLNHSTFFGNDYNYDNPIKSITSIYADDYVITNFRNDLKEIVTLVDILKKHFNVLDATEKTNINNPDDSMKRLSKEKHDNRFKIIKEIEKEFEMYYNFERQYASKMIEIDQKIVNDKKDCLHRMYKADYYRRLKIYDVNIDFYKDIHAAMILLNYSKELITDEKSFKDINSILRSEISKDITDGDVEKRSYKILDLIERNLIEKDSIEKYSFYHFKKIINQVFKIHNQEAALEDDKTGQEIGFWIDNFPSLHVDGFDQTINSFQKISANKFVQGEWDTYMRVRRNMQTIEVNELEAAKFIGTIADINDSDPLEYHNEIKRMNENNHFKLAPELYIPIDDYSVLQSSGFYTTRKTKETPYKLNQTEFVREAMSRFAGRNQDGAQFIGWHSPTGTEIKYMKNRYKFLMQFYKLGTIEISKTQKKVCQFDEWGEFTNDFKNEECKIFKVEVKDLIDYFLKIVDLTNIDTKEMEIVHWLKTDRKYDGLKKRYKIEQFEYNVDKWTYFDNFLLQNFGKIDVRTMTSEIIKKDHIDGGDEYLFFYNVLVNKINEQYYIFNFNNRINNLRRGVARKTLITRLNQVDEIVHYIQSLENKHATESGAEEKLKRIILEKESELSISTDSNIYEFEEEGLLKGTLWRRIEIYDRPADSTRPGTPIYLKDDDNSSLDWFQNKFQNNFFVLKSKCTALPKKNDPDYEQLEPELQKILDDPDVICTEKFERWHQRNKKK